MTRRADVDLVVPTIGRPSLHTLLERLARIWDEPGRRLFVVDDRADPTPSLRGFVPEVLDDRTEIVRGRSAGPAAARNAGWRMSDAPWVAFLDDDVVPDDDWFRDLHADTADARPEVAGVQGSVEVPLAPDRRPTDWERNVRGLQTARWATADMAFRRPALEDVGGFDERFPRAYREDADLALRLQGAGYTLVPGRRRVRHPVPPAGFWVSVRKQAGNADDALMLALHGPRWRDAAEAPRGRRRRNAAVTAAGAGAVLAVLAGRRRIAAAGAAAWLAGTAEFAWSRIAPGPRTPAEVWRMAVTSAVLPAAATGAFLRGVVGLPATLRRPGPVRMADRTQAVLFDRDGTLVIDVPYNGDPDAVRAVPEARRALERLRSAGVKLAVVSNQSGIARGLLTPQQVDAVNARIEQELGPLGPWLVCPHAPEDGCRCRKPAAGLVLSAAEMLGVPPSRCVVVGDTGADVEAARAAGARGILVPNAVTRREEVEEAEEVAADLEEAVGLILRGGER